MSSPNLEKSSSSCSSCGMRISTVRQFVEMAAALTMIFLVIVVASPQAQAGNLTTLYQFSGPDGIGPAAGLTMDGAGNLYGTTYLSGGGVGTVFKLDSSGHETVLHNFIGYPSDGQYPKATLIRDAVGNIYGTTLFGGSFGGPVGYGTVFKLDSSGHETVLHNFIGYPSDGRDAIAGMVMDAAGNLYGTTNYGGSFGGPLGDGTVFKVDTAGHETVLYNFGSNPTDGTSPAGLIMDRVGNLYGTTQSGGSFNKGTVFKMDLSGHETVLYNFGFFNTPMPGLLMDAAGNLYGTTSQGGLYYRGSVFRLDPSGHVTLLYSFGTNSYDGTVPNGSLIMDAAGNLYGTTNYGGAFNEGTVFKLAPSGHETVLFDFDFNSGQNLNHGMYPEAGLVMDPAGNLYGTTYEGGYLNFGTVFKITTAPVPEPNTLLLLGSVIVGFASALRRKLIV